MVDDVKTVDSKNELVKFADDLTLGVPGTESGDTSRTEFDNVQAWSKENSMPLNMKKRTKWLFMVSRLWLCLTLSPRSNERRG